MLNNINNVYMSIHTFILYIFCAFLGPDKIRTIDKMCTGLFDKRRIAITLSFPYESG